MWILQVPHDPGHRVLILHPFHFADQMVDETIPLDPLPPLPAMSLSILD
jgi:hypothetical protein